MPGVYISFPFCAQKCTFCNFASGVFPKELERSYEDALCAELAGHPWEWMPDTVYLGGGTPSRVDPTVLAKWLGMIPGRPWSEATIEAAPGDIQLEKAILWREAGVNRVSLGVQSFVVKELTQTGRKHNADTVIREVEILRRAGIENLSVDLIAGLPHQTVESFGQSLDAIERLGVPHVSIYMLEVDDDSRLGGEILIGGPRYGTSHLPTEDDVVSMYNMAVSRLEAMGIPRYEISNFARPGFESRHNLKYWQLAPYVGFGSDAHSFDGRVRRQNAETAAEYVARWRRGDSFCTDSVEAVLDEERFLTGLRLENGIISPIEGWGRHAEPIHRFVEQGLLEEREGMLRLTQQGVLYSNEVLQEFIQA